jgi:hypothetical protein
VRGVIVADIYDPHSQPLFRAVLANYGFVAMLFGSKIPIAKGTWKPVSDTRRKLRSKDCASRAWRKPRRIGIALNNAGPMRVFMAPRNGKSRSGSPSRFYERTDQISPSSFKEPGAYTNSRVS